MDKIIVNPLDVRGLGNIVSPKTISDFGVLNGTLSSGSDTVNNQSMTVYSTDYLVGSSISLSAVDGNSDTVDVITDSQVTVYAVLKDDDDTVIEGATVYFNVNGTISSDVTDNTGEAEGPTINYGGDDDVYYIRAYYTGTGSLAGCCAYKRLYNISSVVSLVLYGDKIIIQAGDTLKLLAKVEGTDVDGSIVPVPNSRVIFIKYNPELFKFVGTGGTETDTFEYNYSRVVMTPTSAGTLLDGSSPNLYYCWASLGEDTSNFYDFFGDVTIEFDVVSLSNQGALLQIYADGSTNYFQKTLLDDFGCVGGEHIKVTVTENIVECYKDDVKIDSLTTEVDFNNNKYRIGFRGYSGWSLKFKNFVIGGY